MLQEFNNLQREAASEATSAQQVHLIESVLAMCWKLQETVSTASKLQQQHQVHLLHMSKLLDSNSSVIGKTSAPQRLQLTPTQSIRTCRPPAAIKDAEAASRSDQQCPWSGNITTNALFVSTPTTCCKGVTSPQRKSASPAVAARLQGKGAHSSENFIPLQSALRSTKPEVQEKQLTEESMPSMVHRPLLSMQLLVDLQGEMLQWFVQYLEQDCGRCQPKSKADCLSLLKVFSRVQEWLTQQQDGHGAGMNIATGHVVGHKNARFTQVMSPVPKTPQPFGFGNNKAAVDCGADSQAFISQLQQLQTAVRRKLTHFGYLRYQLPA